MTKKSKIFFILFSLIILFLSLNIHSNKQPGNYRCEIHADKAGYYVYLPAFFLYDFNPENFPNNIDKNVGDGFDFKKINPVTHEKVVFTKYSCGVAILDAPFFLVTHLFCKLTHADASGFSIPYHRMRDISSWVYTMLGLVLLFLTLTKKTNFSENTLLLGISLYFLGTNFLYYSIKDVGMSHNYSFFLIALFLYLYTVRYDMSQYKQFAVLGFVLGMLFLVRPINLVFLCVLCLWDISNLNELKLRIINYGSKLFVLLGIAFLVVVPQLAYYYYVSHGFVNYSYGNESFIYLKNPQILRVFFGLENGLFTNNPIHVFTFLGIFYLIKNKIVNGWKLLSLFLGIGLLYSTWWCWGLGCGFSHRGYVEYYAVFVLPFIYLLNQILTKPNKIKIPIMAVLAICILINLKLTFAYDNCWYGKNSWDTQEWLKLLLHTGYVK